MPAPLHNPERIRFVNARLVDRPMDDAERDHWLGVLDGWIDRVNAGEEEDEGHWHWVEGIKTRIRKRDMTLDEIAGAVRHQYIMSLWDAEHGEAR